MNSHSLGLLRMRNTEPNPGRFDMLPFHPEKSLLLREDPVNQAGNPSGASLQGVGLASSSPLFIPGAREGDAQALPGGQPPPNPLLYPAAEAVSSRRAPVRAHPDMNIDGRLDAGNALI